jgi:pyruvate/2-oxoglutarate dehydrogenase complex dihydrolipoamide dehydrogenase (E3) component
VVVGAGSAGLIAVSFARSAGARVLLVERDRIGGDCTWTGCVPSKALIHTAGLVHCMREAAALGRDAVAPTLDADRIMERVRAASDRVYAFETAAELAKQGIEVAFGEARFVAGDAITIGDQRVTGGRFVVCTGAEPLVPPIPRLAETPYLTCKDVFSLKVLPRHLVVLGSGPTGAELAQAFRRLGSEVSLVEAADRLLPIADPDASAVLTDRFAREGVRVYLRSPVERMDGREGRIAVIAAGSRIEADALLVAVGRRPRLEGLNLERADVAFTVQGIAVDMRLRTSNPRIYAAGDAAGSPQFTHYAAWQGYVAARNALFRGAMRGKRGGVPWVVFTDPEVGQVGLTEAQARAGGGGCEVLRLPLERIDRAQTTADLDGFIKLIIRDNTLAGATVVAPVASEIINELAFAIQSGATLRDLSSTIHVYPTYGIGIQQLASRTAMTKFASGWPGRLLGRLMRRSA